MKEVTHEEWLKNPTPRWMWVWDNFEENKHKNYVVYFLTKEEMKKVHIGYPVVTADGRFSHCAEIEEPKLERMTNYELAKWLSEGASCGEFRQCKYDASFTAFTNYAYYDGTDNEPCSDNILIRVNGGEWREPYNIPPECVSPTPDEIGG